MEGRSVRIAIAGGGASGIAAAIAAARRGAHPVICERHERMGRKILASGNGRCNLANEDLRETFYNAESRALVNSVFSRFGSSAIGQFFSGLGLRTYSDNGRIFPRTNQSSSVLKLLELELKRLDVKIEHCFDVAAVTRCGDRYEVKARSGRSIICDRVVLSCGGKSYPALCSNGSGYSLAQSLGHSIVEPVPSAVPLVINSPACHGLQGQKIAARARSLIDGKESLEVSGEVIFTKYGLSGTAILDISERISVAVNRQHGKDAAVSLDMVPFMTKKELEKYLSDRIASGTRPCDMTAGILPVKFGIAFGEVMATNDAARISSFLKKALFRVSGTRGWNEADFTAGGVAVPEVDPSTLESRMSKGIYLSGEILDVCGARGGYNLAWAWASGFLSGEAAADA